MSCMIVSMYFFATRDEARRGKFSKKKGRSSVPSTELRSVRVETPFALVLRHPLFALDRPSLSPQECHCFLSNSVFKLKTPRLGRERGWRLGVLEMHRAVNHPARRAVSRPPWRSRRLPRARASLNAGAVRSSQSTACDVPPWTIPPRTSHTASSQSHTPRRVPRTRHRSATTLARSETSIPGPRLSTMTHSARETHASSIATTPSCWLFSTWQFRSVGAETSGRAKARSRRRMEATVDEFRADRSAVRTPDRVSRRSRNL